MNEKLKELFESSVLNGETKEVLTTAFQEAIDAKEEELKTQHEVKLVEEKAALVDEINKTVEEALNEELSELAEEIEHARSLEVQYAEKLQHFKEDYAEKQDEQMKVMVEEAVAEELTELQEDIENAKKHEFVMSMFESFSDTYQKLFGGTDIDVYDELQEAKQELDGMKKEQKLNELLESVSGEKREIARTILESVSLDKMEKKFDSIKGILLSESTSEKTEDQIDETAEGSEEDIDGTLVLENQDETTTDKQMDEKVLAHLRKSLKFAGVSK